MAPFYRLSQTIFALRVALGLLAFSAFSHIALAQETASFEWNGSFSLRTMGENMAPTQQQFSLDESDRRMETRIEFGWAAKSLKFFWARFDNLPRRSIAQRPDALGLWLTPSDNEDHSAGNHLEGGLAPRFIFDKKSRYPVTVMVPVNIGLGDQEYWFHHQYGYVSGGLDVRVPLSFLPTRYGKWSAGTNADVCYYGTTTAEFMNAVPGLGAIKISAVLRTEL